MSGPRSTTPEAMARMVGRYAHALTMTAIDAGVRNGAPLVGWEATPIERTPEQLKEFALHQADAERAMIALLVELLGQLMFHPAIAYALAVSFLVGSSYDFERIAEPASGEASSEGVADTATAGERKPAAQLDRSGRGQATPREDNAPTKAPA